MDELPVARGLFLCEAVIVEERTRNISLINCFNRRVVGAFPTPPQRFAAFAVFVNGWGTIPVDVRVTDLTDDSLVYIRSAPLTFADPLRETRFVFRFGELTFPHAGRYEVSLASGADVLAATSLEIR